MHFCDFRFLFCFKIEKFLTLYILGDRVTDNLTTYVCTCVHVLFYLLLINNVITDVPATVPGVSFDNNAVDINGNVVTLTLSWGEPFNNLDPIVSYTVSCSSDGSCPPSITTTDRTTIITNLNIMTAYTFSVVAANSIGSGEAGVLMITTPPGENTDT